MNDRTLTFLDACATIALYDYDKMGYDIFAHLQDIENALNVIMGIQSSEVDDSFKEHLISVKMEIANGCGLNNENFSRSAWPKI